MRMPDILSGLWTPNNFLCICYELTRSELIENNNWKLFPESHIIYCHTITFKQCQFLTILHLKNIYKICWLAYLHVQTGSWFDVLSSSSLKSSLNICPKYLNLETNRSLQPSKVIIVVTICNALKEELLTKKSTVRLKYWRCDESLKALKGKLLLVFLRSMFLVYEKYLHCMTFGLIQSHQWSLSYRWQV